MAETLIYIIVTCHVDEDGLRLKGNRKITTWTTSGGN